MKMKNRWFIIRLLSIIVCAAVIMMKNTENVNYNELRRDTKLLKTRFSLLPDFEDCYWKAGTFGNVGIGPTGYWIKGFAVLNHTDAELLQNNYEWEARNPQFSKQLEPSMIIQGESDWQHSREYTKLILTQKFIGVIYFDIANDILYIDAKSN